MAHYGVAEYMENNRNRIYEQYSNESFRLLMEGLAMVIIVNDADARMWTQLTANVYYKR